MFFELKLLSRAQVIPLLLGAEFVAPFQGRVDDGEKDRGWNILAAFRAKFDFVSRAFVVLKELFCESKF